MINLHFDEILSKLIIILPPICPQLFIFVLIKNAQIMLEVHFYLKSVNEDKEGRVPVIAQIADNYKKYRKTLGKVRKKDWDKKTSRAKIPSGNDKRYEDYILLNKLIDRIQANVKECVYDALYEKQKLGERKIKSLLTSEEEIELMTVGSFFEVFEEFINANKGDKAQRTIMGYTTILNYLRAFEKSTGYKITWDSLNLKFLDALKTYHYEVIVKQTGYFAKVQRVLKTLLKWSKKRKYYNGSLDEEFEEKEPEKEVVFLTLDELFDLYNFEFKSDRLSKTRDLFCFSCFTGLRYSDVISMKKEHITKGYYYKTQKKTATVVKNPINNFAQSILDKYKGCNTPLPHMSTQKLNDYIKECCAEVAKNHAEGDGFNKILIKTFVYGGKVEEKSLPKYDAITFHTARKTFITNSMALGMNIKVIQEMGAPKRDKDLRKYLKVSDELKAVAMDQTWNSISKK